MAGEEMAETILYIIVIVPRYSIKLNNEIETPNKSKLPAIRLPAFTHKYNGPSSVVEGKCSHISYIALGSPKTCTCRM